MKPMVAARSHGRCEVPKHCREFIEALDGKEQNAASKAVIEMMKSHDCGWLGVHVHHRKYRSRRGTNSLSNLIHTCNPCHAWIHAYPEASNRLGLSLHAWESET